MVQHYLGINYDDRWLTVGAYLRLTDTVERVGIVQREEPTRTRVLLDDRVNTLGSAAVALPSFVAGSRNFPSVAQCAQHGENRHIPSGTFSRTR